MILRVSPSAMLNLDCSGYKERGDACEDIARSLRLANSPMSYDRSDILQHLLLTESVRSQSNAAFVNFQILDPRIDFDNFAGLFFVSLNSHRGI